MTVEHKVKRAAIIGLLLLPGISLAQTKIQGGIKVNGGVELNFPYTRYVQIMALNPPGALTQDYTTFYNNVMTQPGVDGVTVEIDWSQVETMYPPTPCAPINSETCQLDSAGQYHNYSWTSYDAYGGALGIAQWFDPFTEPTTMITTNKKVNIILSGINAGGAGVNTVTPWYVASPNSNYINNFTPARQDVLNVAKDCTNIPWKGVLPTSVAYYSSSQALVTLNNCCTQTPTTLHDGDTIWVYSGFPTKFNNAGVTITRKSDSTFVYNASSTLLPTDTCAGCIYITAAQSTPVPYEAPYVAAWQAFMAAAIKHFNPGYTIKNGSGVNVVVGSAGTNQLGYVRSGTWVGGESYVYCIKGTNGGTSVGLSTLSSPYNYKCNGSDCSINNGGQTNANNTWLMDFANKVNYIQSLSPAMARYWPIDVISNDNSYPHIMAADAAAAGNGQGYVNGFGSQALSLLDKLAGCGGAIADWCNLFTGGAGLPSYYLYGMPLELQEISISDPTNTTCPGSTCGFPPNGVSGDLRLWLPFAVTYDATVFEIYYADLGLAFDPNYCTSGSGNVCTGYYAQFINTTQEWIFYSAGNGGTLVHGVGQGSHCNPPVTTMSGGAGDCSYASAINSAHGFH
jgi:hypothetical protein